MNRSVTPRGNQSAGAEEQSGGPREQAGAKPTPARPGSRGARLADQRKNQFSKVEEPKRIPGSAAKATEESGLEVVFLTELRPIAPVVDFTRVRLHRQEWPWMPLAKLVQWATFPSRESA